MGEGYRLTLQALADIHLVFDGARRSVRLTSAIALLILLVACANYTNLATARARRRAKEVDVRMVAGAYRRQTAAQFFGESVLMVAISLALALAIWPSPFRPSTTSRGGRSSSPPSWRPARSCSWLRSGSS